MLKKLLTIGELEAEVAEEQARRMARVESGQVSKIVRQFRSWAVTEHGLEHLDPPLYDIPVSRLWETSWEFHMSEKEWVNGFDFLFALRFARKHYRHQRPGIPPRLRYDVLERDGFHCQLCGRGAEDGVKLQVDHRISRDDDGRTDAKNLWTLCRECNLGKGGNSL